uniref:Tripartite motif containing 66 n=1 Tax=Serinus canaria TaxID=9135 RepID=A0A8C9MPP1_SERCA
MSCSMCKEKRPAHSLCTRCNKWLCSSCTEEHRHGQEPGEHFLSLSLKGCTGTGGMEFSLLCPLHPPEALKVFCETCDTLTCRSCLLSEHKEHRFRHLDEALHNQRIILENVITKVEEKKNGIQVSVKQIEDRLLEVKHLYKKVENQIKMAKMVLMNEIDKRTNILLEQLEKITNERKQRLEQQLHGVVILGRQVEHVQNFISWAVCSKKTIPFLFSKELKIYLEWMLADSLDRRFEYLFHLKCVQWPFPCLQFLLYTFVKTTGGSKCAGFFSGGFTMEGGHITHPDVLLCGNIQGLQPSLYHGHHSPASQLESSQPHQFPPALQCSAPVCCSHCLSIPHPNKAQPSYQDMSHHKSFHQPPALHQQHFPLQYSLQPQDREPQAAPQPVKVPQAGLEQQPRSELENVSGRVAKLFPPQQLHQGCAGVHPQASLQTSAVGVQLGHVQKIKSNHVLQPPPQQQQPLVSPQPGHDESAHKQVIQQSLDIMHHQLELEEMKKDLELLLQAQGQPSLQLNQAKPPQHVQQTIVGQINYIVRQPAPAQQQVQDEAQVCSLKHLIYYRKNSSILLLESLLIYWIFSYFCFPQRSASLSFVGFPNSAEMELSPTRLPSSADPEVKGAAAVTPGPSPNALCECDTAPEPLPSYSLALGRAPSDPGPGAPAALAPGDALQGGTKCKVGMAQTPLLRGNPLPFTAQLVCEKKSRFSVWPPESQSYKGRGAQTMVHETEDRGEYCGMWMNLIMCPFDSRAAPKEQRIPYVRLERLRISASEVGELPVFKLQPQDNGQEGNFLLVIECGTRSSSMSIKVRGIVFRIYLPSALYPSGLQDGRFLISQAAGQTQSSSVDQKLSNGISCMKKSPVTQEVSPIENEDFCAVCLNGGELLCCDHCPKVFHLSCHVPALLSFPVGEWVCSLCRNPAKPEVEYDCENTRYSHSYNAQYGLGDCDQKKCEKLVLSLFCSSMSLPFHEPVSPLARHYYQIIKRPMDLSTIRRKLQKKDKSHYCAPEELVTDVRLMFWNCAKFNYPDSEVAEAGRCLDEFFEDKLREIYPDRHFPSMQQDDSDSEDVESQNSPVPPQDFQWPSYGQECVQPKRKRRHADSEKTKRMMFQPANSLPQV